MTEATIAKDKTLGPASQSRKASLGTMLGFATLESALSYVEALSNFALPSFLGRFTNREGIIYLIGSLNPFFNVVVQPYVGWRGDTVWTRIGRRLPFILIGAPFLAVALTLTPYAELSRHPLWWAFFLVLLFQFFDDVVFGAYLPLFGDTFSPAQRGRASAFQQIGGGLGQFLCLAFGLGILAGKAQEIPAWMARWMPASALGLYERMPTWFRDTKGAFLFGALFLALCAGIITLCVREHPPTTPPQKFHFDLKAYYRELFSDRQYIKLYALMLIVTFVGTLVMTFFTRFAEKSAGLSSAKAAAIWSLWPLTQLIVSWPVGKLADIVRHRTIMAIGLGLGALTGLVGFLSHSEGSIVVFAILFGLSIAIQRIGILPIIADYAPPERVGTIMGGVQQMRSAARFLLMPVMGFVIDSLKPVLGDTAFRVPFVLAIVFGVGGIWMVAVMGPSKFTDRA